MSSPRPAMGSRPTAADKEAYNAWARRNGEPLWGADGGANGQAPVVSQSPLTAAVERGTRATFNSKAFRWEIRLARAGGRRWLTNQDGTHTADGAEYSRVARRLGLDNFELLHWRTGLHMLNGSNADVAYDIKGQMRYVKRWNASTGNYEPGRDDIARSFYREHKARHTLSVPVKRLTRKEVPRGSGRYVYVETNNGDLYKYLTDEQIQNFLLGMPGPALQNLAIAPADVSPEQQRRWISEAVNTYLQQMPRVDDWHQLTEFDDSNCIYVWDSEGEIRYDEEITHVRENGELAIQTILNRPLRGMVIVPDDMYGKVGIHPVSWEEAAPGEGNCMLNTLVLGITKRKNARVGKMRTINGEKITLHDADVELFSENSRNLGDNLDLVTENGQRVWRTPKYTLEQMASKVEKCFEELYPLEEPTEEQKEQYPEKVLIRKPPYENGEWRNVGITAEIVKKICQEEKVAVHILHSDRLIQSCYPDDWVPGENGISLCFNIWSDHGFFYDGSTQEGHNVKVGISKMRPLAPSAFPSTKLFIPGDEDDRTNYEDMIPFGGWWNYQKYDTGVLFKQALDEGKVCTFFVDAMSELEVATAICKEKKVQFIPHYGKSPTEPSSLTVYLSGRDNRGARGAVNEREEAVAGACKPREKKCIKVKVVPKQHEGLHRTCKEFNKKTGYKMEYKGEGMAALMDKMMQQLLVTKRKEASVEVKKAIWEKQANACAACGTQLDKRSQLDHRKPLHEGGSNDPENLQYLCRECHESKTQLEELARGSNFHPLMSSMSPRMYETFCQMPKPMVLSGRWAALFPKEEEVRCLDVKGCRTNALVEYQWGLPTFSPLDDWEEYLDEDGLARNSLDYYDFFYVNVPDVDLCDPNTADFYFPYTGARVYCLGAVDYMLKQGILCNDNLVYGVRASRHLAPSKLADAFDTIGRVTELYEDDSDKLMRLALLGLWQGTERREWHEVKSMYVSDCPGDATRREYLGRGVWSFKCCTTVVDLKTMRPFGEIALQMEQVFMHRAMELMKKIPRAMTLGIHVDGLFVRVKKEDVPALKEIMDTTLYPSGQKMFQEKWVKRESFPIWPRRYEDRSFQMDLRSITWRYLNESDAGDEDPQVFFAKQILANKGGFLNSLGGTGKTRIIQLLMEMLKDMAKEEGFELRIVVMSLRHAAKAQLPEGQTIAHVKHKYAKAQKVFYIIDEAGELGAAALWELARHKLVGSHFLLCGDWDGQLLPMFDRWGDVYNERGVTKSHLMHSLANGLSLKLSKCRRTLKDQGHFELVRALYEKKYFRPGEPVDQDAFKEELDRTLQEYLKLFPVKSREDFKIVGLPDCVATISHRLRLLMNSLLNMHHSKDRQVKKWLPWTKEDVPGATMQPQSCYIWPGLEVCGCTRGFKAGQLVNGLIYVIKCYDEEGVTLTMHPDFNKDHLERVKYLQSKLDEFKPKMLDLLNLMENGSTMDEITEALNTDELDFSEILQLGFWVAKKGRGRNAREVVHADEHYLAWAESPQRPLTLPPHMVDPEVELSWEAFQMQARLMHALPYVYYQGKTVAKKTLWLMNVKSPHFTMRHLIMGLGRVQESKRVKILDPNLEKYLVLKAAKEIHQMYHEWTLAHKKEEEEAARILAAASEVINGDVEVAGELDEEEEAGFHGDCYQDVEFED